MGIFDSRREYEGEGLSESSVADDPFEQFRLWFEQAVKANVPDVTAMTLATADGAGAPSARVVLLKGFNAAGFSFFTCYSGGKACDIAANPRAALVFHWPMMDRQVRIEGEVTKVSRAESQAYFATRPRGAQISATVSAQSQAIDGRETLERLAAEFEARFKGREIPCPENWGGYRVAPRMIEFWQGRPNRLHDRLRYIREADGPWKQQRLAP